MRTSKIKFLSEKRISKSLRQSDKFRAAVHFGLVFALALTLKGCATIYTVLDKNEKNKIYSGLGEHIRLQCVEFTCYDAPLSIWLDTYFLPLTIPMTAYNYFLYEEEERYDPTEDRVASRNMEFDLYISPTQGEPPEKMETPEPYLSEYTPYSSTFTPKESGEQLSTLDSNLEGDLVDENGEPLSEEQELETLF